MYIIIFIQFALLISTCISMFILLHGYSLTTDIAWYTTMIPLIRTMNICLHAIIYLVHEVEFFRFDKYMNLKAKVPTFSSTRIMVNVTWCKFSNLIWVTLAPSNVWRRLSLLHFLPIKLNKWPCEDLVKDLRTSYANYLTHVFKESYLVSVAPCVM